MLLNTVNRGALIPNTCNRRVSTVDSIKWWLRLASSKSDIFISERHTMHVNSRRVLYAHIIRRLPHLLGGRWCTRDFLLFLYCSCWLTFFPSSVLDSEYRVEAYATQGLHQHFIGSPRFRRFTSHLTNDVGKYERVASFVL